MKMNTQASSIVLGSVLVWGAVLSEGCVDHVDTALNPCPCATGTVCCGSGVCAEDESSCGAATAALSASVQGKWTGYIENFKPEADDRVSVSITLGADGTLSGTVMFGAGEAPPVATDPALPWPVDRAPEVQTSYIDGFGYQASNIAWLSRRLKLRVQTYEPWKPWCALQQSYQALPLDYYACVPNWEIVDDGSDQCWLLPPDMQPMQPINCLKYSQCHEMCSCNANGCKAVDDVFYSLDIAFGDHQADGSINIWNTNYNLRLTRVPTKK